EDIHGNTSQCSFDVTVFPLPEADIIATDISCNGLGDGALDLTVTNGTAPYNYVWNNGSTDEDLTGLAPGTYDVLVTDDNGCTAADTASIAEPALLEISNTVEDVLCNGGNDGSIDLTVTGGVAPYSYSWSNGSSDEDLTSLIAGTYNVTVTDDNGCTVQSSIDVAEPDTIQVTYTSTPATCEAPNGTITIDVVGGTAPYTYSWSNGETTADLDTAVAGSYELTVTDANGCTFVLQAEVESVSNLEVSVSTTDVTCFGRNNGTATVLVNEGNGPYTYDWSNGETTASLQGLAAGSYELIVTDNYGCQETVTVEISQPDPIIIDLFSQDLGGGYNVKPYDAENGSITTDVFGGTAPYSFNWSTGDTTQDLAGLPAGNYNLIVNDENGCVANASITLTQPMTLEMPEGISPNGDGDNDYFVVRGIDAYEDNEIKIFNRWGNVVYQMNNYDNSWNGESNTGDQLPDATYFVVLLVDTEEGAITLKGYVDLRRKY
ncbi:MAG: gliding motility-associated C-terminal domain-containing protein, partial [Actinobacteria bacterium]|nr:gliding motility-associated C-terminal domain-containing protein [Actinomycetota bacterium]